MQKIIFSKSLFEKENFHYFQCQCWLSCCSKQKKFLHMPLLIVLDFHRKSINVYVKVMASIGEEAFPITLEKMMGFITNQYNKKRQCSMLMNYIGGLSNYFKENNLENLTQHMRFKVFKSGIRRQLKSGIFPYQKEPFNSEWFQNILHFFPVSMLDNARFMLLISLCWHCFLRV